MGKVTPTMSKAVDERMTEDNYDYWKACLKNYFIGKGLWSVVMPDDQGNKEETPSSKVEGETNGRNNDFDEERKNAMALHALQICSGPAVFDHALRNIDKAKDAWERLVPDPKKNQVMASRHETSECNLNFNIRYKELWQAIDNGNYSKTFRLLQRDRGAIREAISPRGDGPLHVALMAGQYHIAKELVRMMEPVDLERPNEFGWTVLGLAAVGGNFEMAEAILKKNEEVIKIKSGRENFLPLIHAALYVKTKMMLYLYEKTPKELLRPDPQNEDTNGATLLNVLISSVNPDLYAIALDLLQLYPELAITKDQCGMCAIRLLAKRPIAFASHYELVFWKRWIYSSIHIQRVTKQCKVYSTRLVDEENGCSKDSLEKDGRETLGLPNGFAWNLIRRMVPGIKELYKMKLLHETAVMLLQIIFKKMQNLNETALDDMDFNRAMWDAVKGGIVEFVVEMIHYIPEMIWREDCKGRSVFANSIVERREKIFSLLYDMGPRKSLVACRHDHFRNNFLHLAAKLSPISQLDCVSGAGLQMQRELQWFKEVGKFVQKRYENEENNERQTPADLFTEEHADLKKEGESWMKNTAASCMVVATLIAALMFTTTFSPPGSYSDSGEPTFMGNNVFLVFIVSNSLSLFSSTTSMLMFLGILTSNFAQEDFLVELPTKLGIGVFSLFFSITTMMLAFGAALFIVVEKRLAWASMPVMLLSLIPISIFVVLEFPLLLTMCRNTYGRGIFPERY